MNDMLEEINWKSLVFGSLTFMRRVPIFFLFYHICYGMGLKILKSELLWGQSLVFTAMTIMGKSPGFGAMA